MLARSRENAEEAGAASVEYLRLMGLVSLAFMWATMAKVAIRPANSDGTEFYAAKLSTARFFMQRLLPQTHALSAIIRSGCSSLMELEADAF